MWSPMTVPEPVEVSPASADCAERGRSMPFGLAQVLQESLDLPPVVAPQRALGLGQRGQWLRIADTCERLVCLPAAQGGPQGGTHGRPARAEPVGPGGQIAAQP